MEKTNKASDFATYLNQKFEIRFASGEKADAILTEVNESSPKTFSIVFRLSRPSEVPQGIHTIGNEKFGSMDLFLVPINRDSYEAVFNFVED